jgi:hypothetical protein
MAEVGQSMQIEADRGLSVALGKQGFDVRGDGGAERAVIEFLAARKSRQVLIRRQVCSCRGGGVLQETTENYGVPETRQKTRKAGGLCDHETGYGRTEHSFRLRIIAFMPSLA